MNKTVESGNWVVISFGNKNYKLAESAVGGTEHYSVSFFFDQVVTDGDNYKLFKNDEKVGTINSRILPSEICFAISAVHLGEPIEMNP